MLEKSHRLNQIKKIGLRHKQDINRKKSRPLLHHDVSLVSNAHGEHRSRNLDRPDTDVSFPRIKVTRSKYVVSRKQNILKSHRGQHPDLKLDHNINSFLKRENLLTEAPTNKSLKFLQKHKQSSTLVR